MPDQRKEAAVQVAGYSIADTLNNALSGEQINMFQACFTTAWYCLLCPHLMQALIP